MGIIALIIALALNLAAGLNHSVPQVLAAQTERNTTSIIQNNVSSIETEVLIPRSLQADTLISTHQSTSTSDTSDPPILQGQLATPVLDPLPFGQTEKIGDHLYRTHVADDSQIATSDDIFNALNAYRKDHGSQILSKDDKICAFAQRRAEDQDHAGGLDTHKGFNDYMADQNHWQELNVHGIGENSSWNYQLSGTHLIEWVFDADVEHRNNQLNPDWTIGCAGVSNKTVDIIFARR